MIVTDGLTKIFTDNKKKTHTDITAVENLSLTVNEGEVFGFLGPNGAGKTTTVRLLACLIATARAMASGQPLQQVDLSAKSWSYEISKREIVAGQPVRFSGRSTDTMHGFGVYHPDGRLLFTMMLMPGLKEPTSLVHTFRDPGKYKVRCLEYCGVAHHAMKDELVVVASNS